MSQAVNADGAAGRRQFIYPGILLVLCLLLFFAFLGKRPLWDIDEGMHAVTAQEMLQSGDWVTPRFNGEVFYDKPPLFNWLTAISFKYMGFTELAARLPVALLGLGCVMITYLLGLRMAGPRMGFVAAAILATSLEFIVLSRAVVHDMALTFFVLMALYFLQETVQRRPGHRGALLAAYASMGFAVLAKGPIGVVLPALVIGAVLILQRQLSYVKRLISVPGILIFLAIAAPWYVLVTVRHPDYARYFFIEQNLMNFLSAQEARHPAAFYTYVPVLLGGFFPWSLLLVPAVFRACSAWWKKADPDALFLLAWSGAIFGFFSAAQSKLPTYILPMFPALALLTARLWEDLFTAVAPKLRRQVVWVTALMAGGSMLGLAGAALSPIGPLLSHYEISSVRVYLLLILVAFCMSTAFLMIRGRRYMIAFGTYVTMIVTGMIAVELAIVPMINPYRSSKVLGRELARLTPAGQPLAFYRRVQDSALFYCDRPGIVLRSTPELMAYLSSSPSAVCMIEKERLMKLDPSVSEAIRVIDQRANKLIIAAAVPPDDSPK